MNHSFSNNSLLTRLIKISQTITNDSSLISEMIQEVKSGAKGPLCSMYKSLFKKDILSSDALLSELSNFFLNLHTIAEFKIVSCSQLGVVCFFMPKGTFFPLHDHRNKVVCTGVLHGSLRYITLNKKYKNIYQLSSKGTAKSSMVMFGTEDFRNIHSLYAREDSIILDIFIPNLDDGDQNVFSVASKRARDFRLNLKVVKGYKKISV